MRYYLYPIITAAVLAIAFSVFGPSIALRFDEEKLYKTVSYSVKGGFAGYKYSYEDGAGGAEASRLPPDKPEAPHITPDEKIVIVSNALNNKMTPMSDYVALIRMRDGMAAGRNQSYALLPNNIPNNTDKFQADAQFSQIISSELNTLSERGIIPQLEWAPSPDNYDFDYYMAVDLAEPQKNVPIALIEFSRTEQLSRRHELLVDCSIDTQTKKVYSLSVRTEKGWDYYDPDNIASEWCDYLGLPVLYRDGEVIVDGNHLYIKYVPDWAGGDKAVVIIGFYEGINEFYIEISNDTTSLLY